jgi:hypothetical protein
MTSNSLQSAQFNPYFQYININNTKKNRLKNFLENPTNTESKINLNPFLPNFYLTTTGSNSDQVITNFFEILFHIKDYLHKMDQCIQIIKLNQSDLKSVSVNLNNLNFSENILGFTFTNASKDQKNLQTYLNSLSSNNNKNKSTNKISIDLFTSTKNVFTKIQKPLALAFIENNYIQNNHYRNYYIQLLNNSNNALTALLQKNNVVSIYAFRPLLEIQACLHKKTIKKNNKINKNGMKNNHIDYKIVGNDNKNIGDSSNKNNKKKLINKIPEYSQLYDTYNYQTLLQTYSDESNQYFGEFYKHMSNIYHQKVGDNTLYDYVMAALQLEKNFLLFLVSNIDKEQVSHLYHLDNVIKDDIHRNIDGFLKFHPSLDLSISTTSSTPTPFSIPIFKNFLDNSISGAFPSTSSSS